jgi:hypothetical protein
VSYDVNPELDDAEHKLAELRTQLAKRDETIEKLMEMGRKQTINPPMGSRAPVYNFEPDGLIQLLLAARRANITTYNSPTELGQAEADQINSDLSKLGGVWAELLGSSTGGTRPPLLSIAEIIESIEGLIHIPKDAHQEIVTLIRRLAGASECRIDPVHPDPPASEKAQIISAKLLLRPELAEEVFRLLMVDFT